MLTVATLLAYAALIVLSVLKVVYNDKVQPWTSSLKTLIRQALLWSEAAPWLSLSETSLLPQDPMSIFKTDAYFAASIAVGSLCLMVRSVRFGWLVQRLLEGRRQGLIWCEHFCLHVHSTASSRLLLPFMPQ